MTESSCSHMLVDNSLERWTEAHWFIHQMEENFHLPDLFRYSANAFIRSLKEVPQILRMELQNHPDYSHKIKPMIDELLKEKLYSLFKVKRDYLVHRGSLELHSKGMVGTTEGRGFKIGMGFPVSPFESSEEAYQRFKEICKKEKVIRGAFGPDCDSAPCIERTWRIPEYPDEDLLEICISAWQKTGALIGRILEVLGAEPLDYSLPCRHALGKVNLKIFSQRDFFRDVDGIEIAPEHAIN